jgi:hypothetical protein
MFIGTQHSLIPILSQLGPAHTLMSLNCDLKLSWKYAVNTNAPWAWSQAFPEVRIIITGFPPRKCGFDPRSSCGVWICVGQIDARRNFFLVLRIPLSILLPSSVAYSPVIRSWYNRPISVLQSSRSRSDHPAHLLFQRRDRFSASDSRHLDLQFYFLWVG